MEICIDFDGTCVTHEYPEIGRSIGAESVLKELVEKGHQLILFTMRSDRVVNALFGKYEETFLTDAMDWFKKNEINLYAVQKNPEQHSWTDSPKAYASLYIDDAALGCPLIVPENSAEKPYADWKKIREILVEQSIL
jgi:hypothetical protein